MEIPLVPLPSFDFDDRSFVATQLVLKEFPPKKKRAVKIMVEGGGWQRDGPVPWYAKLVMGMVIIFGQVDLDTLFLDRLHNQIRESTVYPGTARIGYQIGRAHV